VGLQEQVQGTWTWGASGTVPQCGPAAAEEALVAVPGPLGDGPALNLGRGLQGRGREPEVLLKHLAVVVTASPCR